MATKIVGGHLNIIVDNQIHVWLNSAQKQIMKLLYMYLVY